MTKSINKQQIEILVSLMQGQPQIAANFYKGNKEVLNRFWRNAEEELNSAGPPTKCIAEWKKVWGDQKRYVRGKAASNMKHAKGTGGGPNRQYKLSATETAIYELIGMKESVEGVARKYGLPQAAKKVVAETTNAPTGNKEVIECVVMDCDVVNEVEISGESVWLDVSVDVGEEQPTSSIKSTAQKTRSDVLEEELPIMIEECPTSSRKPKSKKTPSDVLEQELSIQRELCGWMKERALEAAKQTKIQRKTFALKKKHFKKVEQMKREKIELLRAQTGMLHDIMQQNNE